MKTVIGLDIAKRVFQLHSVHALTGEIHREKLTLKGAGPRLRGFAS